MMGRSSGMVLLTTLMMTMLVAWMVLSVMRAVLLLEKVNQKMASTHQDFYELEAAATQIVEKASKDCLSACTQKTEGCALTQGKNHYHYRVLDYGVFPCLGIQSGEKIRASHHWVITIKPDQNTQAALQLRVATLGPTQRCESLVKRLIHQGVLSWRYFVP